MGDLKLCPFCEGKPELLQSEPSTARFNEGAVHFIYWCGGFDCQVMPKPNLWQMSPEEAEKAWNTRPIEQQQSETIDKLVEALSFMRQETLYRDGFGDGSLKKLMEIDELLATIKGE